LFITHLKKQCIRSSKLLSDDNTFSINQRKFLNIFSTDLSEEDFKVGLMGAPYLQTLLFRMIAQNMALSYDHGQLSLRLLAKALNYGVLGGQVYKSGSSVVVGNHVAYVIIGRMNNQSDWVNYALPRLKYFQTLEILNMQKLLKQFPMMDFICDNNPTTDKAHMFMNAAYGINSRVEPDVAYRALVDDHIKYTKLFKDVYTSIYASEPLNFLPLEIIYLSLFIDLPLDQELIDIRSSLQKLPEVKDEGIEALENYLSNNNTV